MMIIQFVKKLFYKLIDILELKNFESKDCIRLCLIQILTLDE